MIDIFEEFKKSPYVQLLKDYFNSEIIKMNEVSTHKSWDEVLGKQYATKILKDLIKQLEIKTEVKKIGNQYK